MLYIITNHDYRVKDIHTTVSHHLEVEIKDFKYLFLLPSSETPFKNKIMMELMLQKRIIPHMYGDW